jgi:hypothetical protein
MSDTWEPANLAQYIKFWDAVVAEMCDPDYPRAEYADR